MTMGPGKAPTLTSRLPLVSADEARVHPGVTTAGCGGSGNCHDSGAHEIRGATSREMDEPRAIDEVSTAQ